MGRGIVDIRKVRQDGGRMTYAFEHEGRSGEFWINIQTGETSLAEPGDWWALFAAQHKIRQAWRAGSLPDRAQWAG